VINKTVLGEIPRKDSPKLLETIFNFHDYLMVIRKRIWTIATIFVVVVSLVAIWNFKAKSEYRATVQILIEPVIPNVVNIEEILGRDIQMSLYYATQYKLLQSQILAQRVVRVLKLSKKKGFGLPLKEERSSLENIVRSAFQSALEFVRGLLEEVRISREGAVQKFLFTPEERAIQVLLGKLLIAPVRRTRLVLLHFEDADPVLAAKISNTLAEYYLKMDLELRVTTTKEASKWLSGELDRVQKILSRAELALQSYKEKYNLVSLEDRQNIVLQKLVELSTAVTKARTERIASEVVADLIQQAKGDIEVLASLPDVIENSMMQKLKKDYIILLRELSELSKRYKDQHPKLVRLNSKIQVTKKNIEKETREIFKNIQTRYQVALTREKSLTKFLEEQKQEALRLNRFGIQYQVLKREADTSRKLYENMLTRTKETDLLEGLKTTNIRIIDRAKVPKMPVRPRRLRNILIAMFGSLFFGVVLVFSIDFLDMRIRTPEEVETIAEAPVIGTIPNMTKKQMRNSTLFDSKHSTHITREYFREIRTMMTFRLGATRKVILVTSCIPREGKTFVAANLAIALCGAEKKVLLIDGDFHRAGVHEIIQVQRKPGLSDILFGMANFADSIYPIAETSLSVIPAGDVKGPSSRIFESDSFRSLIEPLRKEFDYIVVDSAPLLAVSDPLIWSLSVDGVFFVVDVLQVTVEMFRQSANKLKELEVPILGIVLNRLMKSHQYYYYGYYGKYNYYSRNSGRETEERV